MLDSIPASRLNRICDRCGIHTRFNLTSSRSSPQRLHPGLKAGLECLGVDRRDHVTQHVVAGDAAPKRLEPAQERLMLLPPKRDLDEIVRPSDRRSEQKQQDVQQRIQHLGGLARVFQCRKMR